MSFASAAGQAPKRIRDIGYKPMGAFRFGLWMDNDGTVLDEAPTLPLMPGRDYHALALDPMMTHVHPLSKQVLGFHPIDAPLLAHAFHDDTLWTTVDELGESVHLPTAPLLVATKLKSLPDRDKEDKEDKAVKDLCDLYALAAYGGVRQVEIRAVIHQVLPATSIHVSTALEHHSLDVALNHLGINDADFRAVIGPLQLPPG